MNNLILFAWVSVGTITAISELPIHVLFGIVFAGIMIEIEKIEKKIYPILSNIFLSSFVGWAVSFGVRHFKPNWFKGDLKIFMIFVVTVFSYVTIIYLLKNETVQRLIEKYLKNKVNDK